ncbi:MAG: hypothetical protein A2Z25_14230 [Planctomycetes bacterium RBG_16_55_9]|nr:MAG: hypothetical protein A2Z25_14230 [Planctomycetes bacterium RBG_16_55_9]
MTWFSYIEKTFLTHFSTTCPSGALVWLQYRGEGVSPLRREAVSASLFHRTKAIRQYCRTRPGVLADYSRTQCKMPQGFLAGLTIFMFGYERW